MKEPILAVTPGASSGRQRGRGTRPIPVAARIHLGRDGAISVMTGKVEEGQGSRAQLTQAAAEELRVETGRIRLIMADSELAPDDGITAGSRTTPSTVPAVRRGAATARELLTRLAAERFDWSARRGELVTRTDGRGRFILGPMEPGRHLLRARLGERTSAPVEVEPGTDGVVLILGD